jgi:membrane associated rhomboid family serine protease
MNARPSFLSNIPPVVKNLIAINVVVWLATLISPNLFAKWGIDGDLTDILGMHYWASSRFNPAQLITYMFMHSTRDFGHIFFNMFAVFMFGMALEYRWGSKRFLFYYLFTGLGAALVQQLIWTIEYQPVINAINNAIAANSAAGVMPYEDFFHSIGLRFQNLNLADFKSEHLIVLKTAFMNAPVTVGASGAVFGLLLAFGWLFPEERLMIIFFPIPIRARIFVLIYGVVELFLGVANFNGDSVAHFAHLGGLLFGVILMLIWKRSGRNRLFR